MALKPKSKIMKTEKNGSANQNERFADFKISKSKEIIFSLEFHGKHMQHLILNLFTKNSKINTTVGQSLRH